MGADPAAEEQFGPYLVYERLGVGGMATVHRALERGIEGFERMVALKRLLPHLAEDASFIKSFVREAKLASLLNHVNIVQIFELGRVASEYFISMEYIDGRDIRRILRHARKVTGPPPINITVGMLLQLCEALDYAHTKSDDQGLPLLLVHRDVSPSNVLVTSAGHLKVIDFGIAKAQSSQLRTQTGRVKGKLAYMAPEAVSGSKDLDARSDLWAVGVIAHELLTARPLFASKNEYQTLLKVQRGDIVPPSTFNQACPPELDAIVAKALEREPDSRFDSAAHMRDALMELRRKKGLQTGYREISSWIEWAFSIDAPSGSFASTTSFEKSRTPTPKPRRDDDEAVEIAWGGGDQASAEPLLLDDVPDVSEKHLGAAPMLFDAGDDIPSTPPSHGHTLPPRASTVAGVGVRGTGSFAFQVEPKTNPTRGDHDLATDPTGSPLILPAPGDDVPTDDDDAVDIDVGTTPAPLALPLPPARPTPRPSARQTAETERGVALVQSALDSNRVPRTKPGVGEPIRARSPTSLPFEAPFEPRATPRPQPDVTIGQAMVERQIKPRRIWPILVAILVAGGAALGVTLYVTRDQTVEATKETPKPRQRQVGTVKFVTEPADAEIRIEGMAPHVGSPWGTELDVGTHQIEVHHDGYKAWLSSVEVSANETNTMTVALGPLGTVAAHDAVLMLAASSPGLEAVIDGRPLDVKTPIKMPIKSGPHTIILRKDGIEVWKTAITAQPSTDYTYDPSFTPAKQIEREQQRRAYVAARPVTPAPEPEKPAPPEPEKPAPIPEPEHETAKPVAPAPEPVPPPPVAKPAPLPVPIAKPSPGPVAPRPDPAAGPALVAPSAVTKLSGETPHLGVSRNVDLPPVVSAKLCIDADGKVTNAYAITKIERHAAEDLADVLKGWRYAPYKVNNVPTAACFAVSFRVK